MAFPQASSPHSPKKQRGRREGRLAHGHSAQWCRAASEGTGSSHTGPCFGAGRLSCTQPRSLVHLEIKQPCSLHIRSAGPHLDCDGGSRNYTGSRAENTELLRPKPEAWPGEAGPSAERAGHTPYRVPVKRGRLSDRDASVT